MITKEQLFEAQPGDKFYIEVTIDLITKADYMSVDGAWVQHPLHPKNEYGCIFVTADDLIPIPETPLEEPDEELEPYFVLDSPNTYNICKRGESGFAATFFKKHPLARKKADEYCEALNEESRKEAQQC